MEGAARLLAVAIMVGSAWAAEFDGVLWKSGLLRRFGLRSRGLTGLVVLVDLAGVGAGDWIDHRYIHRGLGGKH